MYRTSSTCNKKDSWAGTYNLWSSKVKPKSEESGFEQARSATSGTAEQALTHWNDSAVVENQPKKKQSDLELKYSASERGSWLGAGNYRLESSKVQPTSKESDIEQAQSESKQDSWAATYKLQLSKIRTKWPKVSFRTGIKCKIGTAERALTPWSRRKFSRKVRSKV
jgi:hypothetical protein